MLVDSGRLHIALCGLDTVSELQVDVAIRHCFEEERSALSLCKPQGLDLNGQSPLVIATEYPRIADRYLRQRFEEFKLFPVRGACEAYPHLDGISGILDIVETGETLRANGLEVVGTAEYTCPCLIESNKSPGSDLKLDGYRELIMGALKAADGKEI